MMALTMLQEIAEAVKNMHLDSKPLIITLSA